MSVAGFRHTIGNARPDLVRQNAEAAIVGRFIDVLEDELHVGALCLGQTLPALEDWFDLRFGDGRHPKLPQTAAAAARSPCAAARRNSVPVVITFGLADGLLRRRERDRALAPMLDADRGRSLGVGAYFPHGHELA